VGLSNCHMQTQAHGSTLPCPVDQRCVGPEVIKSDHEETAYGELYVIDLNGNIIKRLTNNSAREDDIHWSPDGDKISYLQNHYDANLRSYVNDIYTVDVESGAVTMITNGIRFGGDYAWSPDGDELVMSGELANTNTISIYTMKKDGTKVTKIENVDSSTHVKGWDNVAE
jgi:Tol biopolymer transport system component